MFTNPLGINSSGDIVGRFCTTLPCMPEGTNVHGFLLRDGAFFTIDIPMSKGTTWKINARGDIVGGYTDADGSRKIFLLRLRERDCSTVEVFGGGEPRLDNGGINSRGEIVGSYCETTPCQGDAQGFMLALSGSAVLRTDQFPRLDSDECLRHQLAGGNRRDLRGRYGRSRIPADPAEMTPPALAFGGRATLVSSVARGRVDPISVVDTLAIFELTGTEVFTGRQRFFRPPPS